MGSLTSRIADDEEERAEKEAQAYYESNKTKIDASRQLVRDQLGTIYEKMGISSAEFSMLMYYHLNPREMQKWHPLSLKNFIR